MLVATPNQFDAILRWNEPRPGPGYGERYVRLSDGTHGMTAVSDDTTPVTVIMDGDDISFQTSETRKLATPLPSLELGTRTNVAGHADARSTIGSAGRAVLDALAGSDTLQSQGPSGTHSLRSDYFVTLTERDSDGKQVRATTHGYTAAELPADVARAFEAARNFAQQFDGQHASLILQDENDNVAVVK